MSDAEFHGKSDPEEPALRWATRLDAGDLTGVETEELEAWLRADPTHEWRLAHYRQFYAKLHGTLPAMAAEGVLPREPVTRQRRHGWLAVASMVAMLVLGVAWWWQRPVEHFTLIGRRQTLVSADGTRVDLNASSELSVRFMRDRRIARLLRGEAAFQVSPDAKRPFFVETPTGTLQVTGTWFNVRLPSPDRMEVSVLEGRVEVQPVDQAGLRLPIPPTLTAGDQLHFNAATRELHRRRPAAIENVVAWREGKVVFQGTRLGDATEFFATYHGREITVARDVAALELGGRYTLDDLDQFLDSLTQALPVRILRQSSGRIDVVHGGAK